MPSNKIGNVSRHKSRNKLWLAIGVIAIILIAVGAYEVLGQSGNQSANHIPTATPTATATSTTTPTSSGTTGTRVLLHTSAGDITILLRTDKPITTANFINIVQKGWYDGTIFHRVVAGFMIQGGQISQTIPTINDEIGTNNHNTNYTIAMAKTSSPNSATSEFFINAADNSGITYPDGTTFDGTYTVFGTVVSGQTVVDSIANAPVTTNSMGENSQPVHPVTLIKASIIS
jgi:cyclophilin family peptidyl-prolyl cis-trans isomerase